MKANTLIYTQAAKFAHSSFGVKDFPNGVMKFLSQTEVLEYY